MKSQLSDPLRSSGLFQNSRSKVRKMEWFIAIFFIVSLLIGSGVFIKASNASSLKSKSHSHLSYSEVTTIPGAIRKFDTSADQVNANESSVIYMESEDSCELKKVKS